MGEQEMAGQTETNLHDAFSSNPLTEEGKDSLKEKWMRSLKWPHVHLWTGLISPNTNTCKG